MANITTCPRCNRLYEESSEEWANSPWRLCEPCWKQDAAAADMDKDDDQGDAAFGRLSDEFP